jgi:hypothetical protein
MSSNTSRREFLSTGLSAGLALPVLGATSAMVSRAAIRQSRIPRQARLPNPGPHRPQGHHGGHGMHDHLGPQRDHARRRPGHQLLRHRARLSARQQRAPGGRGSGSQAASKSSSPPSRTPPTRKSCRSISTPACANSTPITSTSGISTPGASRRRFPTTMIEVQQLAKKQGKVRFTGVSTHSGQPQLLPWMAQKGVFDVVLTAYNFTMDAGMDQGHCRRRQGRPRRGSHEGDGRWSAPSEARRPEFEAADPGRRDARRAQVGHQEAQHRHHHSQHHGHGSVGREPQGHGESPLRRRRKNPLRASGCHPPALLPPVRPVRRRCQKGLPVADVLRFLTYADGYGQFALGRERFLELSAEHQLSAAAIAPSCTVNCPHGVQVPSQMARAQELFA